MGKNVQANFQMLDSYVNEFNLKLEKKIDSKENMSIEGKVNFSILNIEKKDDTFFSQIELINDIDILYKNEKVGILHISMQGIFKYEGEDENVFIDMLKLNGVSTLSHLTRAYVYSTSALSGMPQVTIPMINYVNFFENNKEE